MTPENFCYWLRGFFEITHAGDGDRSAGRIELNEAQVKEIRRHLSHVFRRKALMENPKMTLPLPGDKTTPMPFGLGGPFLGGSFLGGIPPEQDKP